MHRVQAQWNEDYYGVPPTLVLEAFVVPASNIRPVKVYFTINSNTHSELLAFISWSIPHSQRYSIGKPAELWKSEHNERFGLHSFLPLNQVISRCAHGILHYNDENLLVVIPLI